MKKINISSKSLKNQNYISLSVKKVYPVYLISEFEGVNVISSAEAEYNKISTEGLKLASITDLIQILEDDFYTGVFGGKVKVKEGIFRFDHDTKGYELLKS